MLFPAFLYGRWGDVEASAVKLGAEWAYSFEQEGEFPSFEQRRVRVDEVVIDSHEFNYDPEVAYWRLSAIFMLVSAVRDARPGHDQTRTDLEAALQATPWGTLVASARQRRPHTVAAVAVLARSLLAHWEPLSTLRYLGKPRPLGRLVSYPIRVREPIRFDEHVGELFAGPLAVWGDPRCEDMRQRLQQALLAMESAPADDVRTRIVTRMVELAREDPRLRELPALADTQCIADYYDRLGEAEHAALRAGEWAALASALHKLASS